MLLQAMDVVLAFFHEPFRMSRIGCAQHMLSLFDYCFCFAIMESLWRQQADAGMMMFTGWLGAHVSG
jgi:hypothetical protein